MGKIVSIDKKNNTITVELPLAPEGTVSGSGKSILLAKCQPPLSLTTTPEFEKAYGGPCEATISGSIYRKPLARDMADGPTAKAIIQKKAEHTAKKETDAFEKMFGRKPDATEITRMKAGAHADASPSS